MSSSDETYLEAFIEQFTTLPHQLRRNLDLLRDLDGSCSVDLHRLRKLQREYILAAEEKMMQLEVVEMKPEVEDDNDDDEGEGSQSNETDAQNKQPVYGVRVVNADRTTSPDNPVVVPTTEEFMEYTYIASPYQQILKLQQDCLQKADEKVAVAQQAYEMMDAQVQRLDADLAAMEQLLLVRPAWFIVCSEMRSRADRRHRAFTFVFSTRPTANFKRASWPNPTIWRLAK